MGVGTGIGTAARPPRRTTMQPATREDAAGEGLSPVAQSFVLHWGEMGSRWGVNRTVAQIHALLYFHGRPFHAEELADLLGVARSNISTSLRELMGWNLVRVVHRLDDRRDHYETARDPWDLLRIVVRERKAREFDPTIAALRDCVADRAFAREPAETQARVRDTLQLMESLSQWTDDMLLLTPGTLTRLMRMGARIQTLLGRGKPKARRTGAARKPA
jgi:DNA-binding transcriptional regulator GbsR (MarR family)